MEKEYHLLTLYVHLMREYERTPSFFMPKNLQFSKKNKNFSKNFSATTHFFTLRSEGHLERR